MSLTETVRNALSIPAPQDSQHAVQEAIARHLDAISSGTSIKRTGYFNHAWVPDLVVTVKDSDDRPVFLRFGVHDASFNDDLEYLADDRPFFLDIARDAQVAVSGKGTKDDFDLGKALQDRGRERVLVSEIEALDRFESGINEHREARAATKQIVVGGKGLVDPLAASAIVSSWYQANEAARTAKGNTLRGALNSVERFLDRNSSLDLEADLRATWISAGHDAEEFPGSEEWQIEDRGPHEIADLVMALIKRNADVPNEQWAAIGRAVSLTELGHQLASLNQVYAGGPVNKMAQAGLVYWTAKYAYVPALDSDSLAGTFDWEVGKYSIALNLIRRRAFFTDTGRKWSKVPRPVRLPDARERLEALDRPVVLGAGILTPEEHVSHELRSSATRSLADRLSPFLEGDPSWRSAQLQWLELKVPGTDLKAHVDFSRDVVRADASIPLRTFVLLVGEFVAALTGDELERLEESLAEPGPMSAGSDSLEG